MDKSIFSRAKIHINSETNDMHLTIDGKVLTEWEEKKALDYIFEDINQRKFEERFGKKKTKGKAIRKFNFDKDMIKVTESIIAGTHFKSVKHIGKFKAIHMASSGYYTKQAISNTRPSKLVEFNRI